MANRGIKVGSNLDTNTDDELKLTSKYSTLKLFKWGNTQFTTNGSGEGSVTIAHDLGYTPIVQVFKKITAQYTFLAATTYTNAFYPIGNMSAYDYGNGWGFLSNADDENIYITVSAGSAGSQASTTYYFRYMIFVDLSDAFSSASNISLTGDRGFKIAKPGNNVLTGEEYEMAYSSKYKAIQYYDDHIKSSSLTLPEMWATKNDTYEEEATYVDFNHSLGYAPFFLVFSNLGGSSLYEVPYMTLNSVGGGNYSGLTEVSAWSDSSRVRVLFRRISQALSGVAYGTVFGSTTISIKVFIFAEDLTGEASP